MKDYGARKLQFANDIALVELASAVTVTAWTMPVCVDWALEKADLRPGELGTVRDALARLPRYAITGYLLCCCAAR